MNDVAAAEQIVLESIFADSFVKVDDTTSMFVYDSRYYRCELEVTVKYSSGYPAEPLQNIMIRADGMTAEAAQAIKTRIRNTEQRFLNGDRQAYVYQIVSSIDDEDFEPACVDLAGDSGDENRPPSPANDDDVVLHTNHGELPGRPVTAESFANWLNAYTARHSIRLALKGDWTQVTVVDEADEALTGYEYFRRKAEEQRGDG